MFGRRPDADLCRDIPDYRRIMPYIMRGRNESAFYFQQQVDLTKTEAFLADFNEAHPETRATPFHLVMWAAVRTLGKYPRLNRFAAGRKVWQRRGIHISFAAKKRLDNDSPLVVLKREFDPAISFGRMVEESAGDVRVGRSDERSHTDKELSLLLKLPGPMLRLLVAAERWLDSAGLLPKFFIEGDPMFCSVFLANLGSLKMEGGFHHLYEYGNCPVFGVVGRVNEIPVAAGGAVEIRRVVNIRWSYDERVEDGLYAQHALEELRALVEDPVAAGAVD